MARWGGPAVRGTMLGALGVLLAGCGPSSAGAATPADPPPAGAPAAPAGLSLPCQPGSGRQITSAGPMNLTDLSGQQLGCAVFDHLTMNEVNLRSGQLSGARFAAAILNKVNFSQASLIGAVFDGSTLNFPDFSKADLRGANLKGAHLNNPVWTGATCPDGATGASCEAHLEPLATTAGESTSTPEPPAPTTTAAAPPATTKAPAPPAQDAPQAPAVFNKSTNGTYKCGGGTVSINGAGSTLHLIGQCDLVVVNGAGSHVEIEAASRIVVNGVNAEVTYHSNAQVTVNGKGATAHRS